jgi:hypothetical protein
LQPGEELLSGNVGIVGVPEGYGEAQGLPSVNLPQLPQYDPNEPLPMPEPSGQVIEVEKEFDLAAGPDVEVVPDTPQFALADVYQQIPDILRFVEADMARTQRRAAGQPSAPSTASLGFGGGGMSAQDRQIANLIGFSAEAPTSQTTYLGGTGEAPGRARGGETGVGAAGEGTGVSGTGEGTGGGRTPTYATTSGTSGYRSQLPGLLTGFSPSSGALGGFASGDPEGFAPAQFDGGERKLKPKRPVWNIASLRVKEDEGVA